MTAGMNDQYFESMYETNPDPWGFDTRFYEQRKYDVTMAALTRATYREAFEPGCANGALTARLAERCHHLTSCDIIEATVLRARARLVGTSNVDVVVARFPDFWPPGELDLVVWSEVAYYLSASALDVALVELDNRLCADGDLVVVNYTGATNYPQTADQVDARIVDAGRFERRVSARDELFRLDVWSPRKRAAELVEGRRESADHPTVSASTGEDDR